ncbi:MAG: hypothetical protein ABEI52_12565, partial [Halobacteriaceae archaeon]
RRFTMTSKPRIASISTLLVIATLIVPGALVGVVVGAEAATITAEPNTVGAISTHTVTAAVEAADDGAPLNDLVVDYNSASRRANVNGVTKSDVLKVGVDTDGDGTIDTSLSDSLTDVTHENNFHTIEFNFDGSYTLDASTDRIIITFKGVTNPSEPGTYQTQVAINSETTDNPAKA